MNKRHFKRKANERSSDGHADGSSSSPYMRRARDSTSNLQTLQTDHFKSTQSATSNNIELPLSYTQNSNYYNAPAFSIGKSCIAVRSTHGSSKLDVRPSGIVSPYHEKSHSPGVGEYGKQGQQYIKQNLTKPFGGVRFPQEKRYFAERRPLAEGDFRADAPNAYQTNVEKSPETNARRGSPARRSVEVRIGSEKRFLNPRDKVDGNKLGPGPAAYNRVVVNQNTSFGDAESGLGPS